MSSTCLQLLCLQLASQIVSYHRLVIPIACDDIVAYGVASVDMVRHANVL